MREAWVVSLLWGASFPLAKIALGGFHPLWLTSIRFLVGALILGIVIGFGSHNSDPALEKPSVARRDLAIVVLFEFGLMYLLYLTSLNYLPPGEVAALTRTTPVAVLILEVWLVGTLPSGRKLLAVLVAAVGVTILYFNEASRSASGLFSSVRLMGYLAIMASNTSFAFAIVWISKKPALSSLRATAFAQGIAGVLVGVVGLSILGTPSIPEIKPLLATLYLALLPTGLGFWLWNRGIARVGALAPSLISNSMVAVAFLISFFSLMNGLLVSKRSAWLCWSWLQCRRRDCVAIRARA